MITEAQRMAMLEAAERVQEFARKHEELILVAYETDICMLGDGLTKSECSKIITDYLGGFLDATQVCRRMKKLEEDGKVIRTEIKRKNAAGRSETVWRLA